MVWTGILKLEIVWKVFLCGLNIFIKLNKYLIFQTFYSFNTYFT